MEPFHWLVLLALIFCIKISASHATAMMSAINISRIYRLLASRLFHFIRRHGLIYCFSVRCRQRVIFALMPLIGHLYFYVAAAFDALIISRLFL